MAAGCLAGLAMLLAAGAAAFGASQQGANPDVVFEWLCEKQSGGSAWESIPVANTISLVKTDEIRFSIRPETARTFVYLFALGSKGAVALLFPENLAVFADKAYAGTRYDTPGGDEALSVGSLPAVESFILIASAERLRDLETKVAALRTARPEGAPAARQAVLDEILTLRRKHGSLLVVTDGPVEVAGSFATETKGLSWGMQDSLGLSREEDKEIWTRVEAVGFYIRTFRIEH
jgi:hypothetical protein